MKTYSCGVLVKGTGEGDNSGVDYYGVLEEVLRVEYLGEPIKRCVLFRCNWFDPVNPRGMWYSRLNCTYEVNHSHRYASMTHSLLLMLHSKCSNCRTQQVFLRKHTGGLHWSTSHAYAHTSLMMEKRLPLFSKRTIS